MNIPRTTSALFVISFLLLLNYACTSNIQATKQLRASSKTLPSTTKTTPNHPNANIKTNNNFISTPAPTLNTTPDIKASPFSKNLERILNTKSEKNVKISGDVYLINDEELGAAPLLKKVDGGEIDVEIKFK